MKICMVSQLPDELEAKLEAGLNEYSHSHGVNVDYRPFSLVLYNSDNEVIGILKAFSSYLSVYINELWIDKAYRGHGYGRRMLLDLENKFKGQGFDNINLVTCAFQAPDFYKKCGYTVEHIRKNFIDPKLTLTSLIKRFD